MCEVLSNRVSGRECIFPHELRSRVRSEIVRTCHPQNAGQPRGSKGGGRCPANPLGPSEVSSRLLARPPRLAGVLAQAPCSWLQRTPGTVVLPFPASAAQVAGQEVTTDGCRARLAR